PLSLPFAAMRKSAWQRHNFYTRAWGSEDTEWGHWARTNGLAVRYVPESLAMHSHDYTPTQIYGRRFIEGEADAFIYEIKDGLVAMCRRVVGRTLRDWASDMRSGEWGDLALAPFRRLAGSWGYFRGNRLGGKRRQKSDPDGSVGQKTALRHHESSS
ncbi:MAG: glycosyltransferase family 2 protein, partial [Deltaproteobacteria bacterium]|nr:glycosyltransferase family 2 protein [Deltaproteobacteria bacterium]